MPAQVTPTTITPAEASTIASASAAAGTATAANYFDIITGWIPLVSLLLTIAFFIVSWRQRRQQIELDKREDVRKQAMFEVQMEKMHGRPYKELVEDGVIENVL